jgi:hypothetical protein
MGHERARRWRSDHPSLPARPRAEEVVRLLYGSYAADMLGVTNESMKAALIRTAPRFRAEDYFDFDPAREPPPSDISEQCGTCRKYNRRGVRTCANCGSALAIKSSTAALLDAIVPVYIGESYGVPLGARLEDVTQWIPQLRPYQDSDDVTYTVTHLIYALNGYSRYRLNPGWLPDEFAFLKARLSDSADPETVGELLDSLKSFGMTEADPLVRSSLQRLLSRQNRDGSWGDPNAEDVYSRYHPTWTAIDGLRDYGPREEAVTSREALRRAQGAR